MIKKGCLILVVLIALSTISCSFNNDFSNKMDKNVNIDENIINNNINIDETSNIDNEVSKFLDDITNDSIVTKQITTYGQTTRKEEFTNTISKISLDKLNILEDFVPTSNSNRPQTKIKSVEFIVIHDTGNNGVNANSLAHSNVIKNLSSSWHYVVDEKDIINNIPENEVAYHAGDGLRSFNFIDTLVSVTSTNCIVSVSNVINGNVYYVIDGNKTNVIVPRVGSSYATNKDLVGIYATISKKNTYLISTTYYNSTYKKIANTGGGSNGIGIEMCINYNNDLYKTMQNTAKLTAFLLNKYNLDITRVLQHNNFSGKMCPQTIIKNDLWDTFIEMVTLEIELINNFSDYLITTEVEVSNSSSISFTYNLIINGQKKLYPKNIQIK